MGMIRKNALVTVLATFSLRYAYRRFLTLRCIDTTNIAARQVGWIAFPWAVVDVKVLGEGSWCG